jgi:hypothetical protein
MYRRRFPAELILRCMDEAGVDRSVVFGVCMSSEEAIALTKAEVAKAPDRLIGFAYALAAYDRPIASVLQRAITARGWPETVGCVRQRSSENSDARPDPPC